MPEDAQVKPKIVIFSGPRATIQNSAPLRTSQTRRGDATVEGYDALRAQRLAAPVTVYVEAYSAHPLEKDAAELYGSPDGYVDPSGQFSPVKTARICGLTTGRSCCLTSLASPAACHGTARS
jgi:L-asparaginase